MRGIVVVADGEAHAPKHLHDELTADYRDMIHSDTAAEVQTRRKAFLKKWRVTCRAVADSLEEAGGRGPAPVVARKNASILPAPSLAHRTRPYLP